MTLPCLYGLEQNGGLYVANKVKKKYYTSASANTLGGLFITDNRLIKIGYRLFFVYTELSGNFGVIS